jgi:predicted DNA-binding ribbon-helix-helix protein
MGNRVKARSRAASSVRQSVTIPGPFATEVRRVAKQRHLTVSRALVALAEKGVEAEAAARKGLEIAYERFVAETDSARKNDAGKDLIRAIFGRDAIAEDSIRRSSATRLGTPA